MRVVFFFTPSSKADVSLSGVTQLTTPSHLGQQYAQQHASHDAVVVQKPNEHSIRAPSDVDDVLNTQALQNIRGRAQQAAPLLWDTLKTQGGRFGLPSHLFKLAQFNKDFLLLLSCSTPQQITLFFKSYSTPK